MFRFPLQRILDLKAKREEEIARQLATAQAAAEESRRVRDSLSAAHEAGRHHLHGTVSSTVGEMQTLALVLGHMREHVASADLETAAAEAAVAQVHHQLTAALQERRVLDKLRERRLEAHHSDEQSRDRQAMDAIALSRYTRSDNTPRDGDRGRP